jgi:hypothetical protein
MINRKARNSFNARVTKANTNLDKTQSEFSNSKTALLIVESWNRLTESTIKRLNPSPDSNGNPFYAEFVSVSLRRDRNYFKDTETNSA